MSTAASVRSVALQMDGRAPSQRLAEELPERRPLPPRMEEAFGSMPDRRRSRFPGNVFVEEPPR